MPNLFGYVRDKVAMREYRANTFRPYADDWDYPKGDGKGAQVRLVKAYEAVTGTPHKTHVQEIGDCVSHGGILGVDFLSCVEIANGEREQWKGKFSTEVGYGLSRVEIGGNRIRGDGSTGAWMAQALTRFGVLLRGVYGRFDLSQYNPKLAKEFGARGCPDELEDSVREHPIRTTTLVTSYTQYRDMIAAGYPVFICSNRGFGSTRDRQGFLAPRGTWYHCMLGASVDDKSDRKGAEIYNSWPLSWISGPEHTLGTSEGAFWADASVLDKMLAQGDSYAISGFDGFPKRKLDYIWL